MKNWWVYRKSHRRDFEEEIIVSHTLPLITVEANRCFSTAICIYSSNSNSFRQSKYIHKSSGIVVKDLSILYGNVDLDRVWTKNCFKMLYVCRFNDEHDENMLSVLHTLNRINVREKYKCLSNWHFITTHWPIMYHIMYVIWTFRTKSYLI